MCLEIDIFFSRFEILKTQVVWDLCLRSYPFLWPVSLRQQLSPAGGSLNKIPVLRPEDCKYRELIFKTEITDFFIFCQGKPFGKLFSKISLRLAREFLVWEIQQIVKLRLSRCGRNKFSRKLRHIHVSRGEIRLGQLKWSFICKFGITITTKIRSAEKCIFTSG